MNELKTFNFETQTISARELHEMLGIEKRFSAWFETNSQGFVEGVDYTSVLKSTEVQNNGGVQLRELQDYNCSLDMAKHICLMSRTEKGKQVRQYLIELERAWNTPELVMARGLQASHKLLLESQEKVKLLTADVERMKPKEIFADAVSASDSSILIRDLAKILRQNGRDFGEKRLYKWMRDNGFIIKHSTQPTQKAMELGLFEIIERTVQRPDLPPIVSVTTKVTGKGQQYFINKLLGGKHEVTVI